MPAWDISTSARHHFGRLWDRLVDLTGVANPPMSHQTIMDPRIEFIRPPDQFSNIGPTGPGGPSGGQSGPVQRNVAFDDRYGSGTFFLLLSLSSSFFSPSSSHLRMLNRTCEYEMFCNIMI